jgi:hypothetical protein
MTDQNKRKYEIKILGRVIEHLGVQMYKLRDAAIAELVANCWDAGATEVFIDIPISNEYDMDNSVITIRDNGEGMNPDEVETDYLVVGRNARKQGDTVNPHGHPVMGRKGIGKLAGFGVATGMEIFTWQKDKSVKFFLDMNALKADDGEVKDVEIMADISTRIPEQSESGTILTLAGLKHKSPIDIEKLHTSLSRRFSRLVKGKMEIYINSDKLKEYELSDILKRCPTADGGYAKVDLGGGKVIEYWYAITKKVIPIKMIQGFSVIARGKVAQLPPFYFNVENTASHQHGTKYFTGEICADFIDEGVDDESDRVSTDRQEIDWDDDNLKELYELGAKLTRQVLNECYELGGQRVDDWILKDDAIKTRIEDLDEASQKSIKKVLPVIGRSGADEKEGLKLIDQLVRAYEFKYFHNVIGEIEEVASEDPIKLVELLKKLNEWKVLESRAMLELINGRLNISDKLNTFIIEDIPETASVKTKENLHDLIGRMPWLLNPEWDLFDEEKTISKTLNDWYEEDLIKLKPDLTKEEARMRYDFIALTKGDTLLVIDIKRSGSAIELEEIHRLESYMEKLKKSCGGKVKAVLICSGNFNINKGTIKNIQKREDFEIIEWSTICKQTKDFYEHYRGVLEGNIQHKDMPKNIAEIKQHNRISSTKSIHRTKKERKEGQIKKRAVEIVTKLKKDG